MHYHIIPTNIHTANRIFTNFILMTDKHNIPKGKMHSNCKLLPEDIVCKIISYWDHRHINVIDGSVLIVTGRECIVEKGFNQIAPLALTITVAFDMSKAFDTINIHTLIRKLLQTNIPGTIIKFIANYIKGRKAYTTYRNHTSRQRQFETGIPQGGVLSPRLFNIYTSDIPPHSAPVQGMAYADVITITSTHTSTSAAKKYIQPYIDKVFV